MPINDKFSKIIGIGFCCLKIKSVTETVMDMIGMRKKKTMGTKSSIIAPAEYTAVQMVAAVNVQANA